MKAILINVKAKQGYVNLEIEMNGDIQCISIENSNTYEVDTIIRSWKYPWNLNGLSNHYYDVPFYEVLDTISSLRLSKSKHNLPWYTKIDLLLKDLYVKENNGI